MVLQILFWVLLILCFIGAFVPDDIGPGIVRGRWVVVLIELAILGFFVFNGSSGSLFHR